MTAPAGDPDKPLTYETPSEAKPSVPTDETTEEPAPAPGLDQTPEEATPAVPPSE